MEKTKFAAQVLLIMTVIPVIFIGTLMGNDTRIHTNTSQEHIYTSYPTTNRAAIDARKRIAGLVLSCGRSRSYAKK
jgi:hypothetical protein